ncbi:hypothetical protein Tco_0355295 [Tanacetum coccineum]
MEFTNEEECLVFMAIVIRGGPETLFEKSGKKENNLDEEHKDKQEKNSEDLFNIYKLLKKKKDTTEKEINLSGTNYKNPPVFNTKEGF